MNNQYSKLQQVQAMSSYELYSYLAMHSPDTLLRFTTRSGRSYSGSVVTIGKITGDDSVLLMRIWDDQRNDYNSILHIALNNIESTEVFLQDAMKVLSGGRFTEAETYEVTGKLALQKKLKELEHTLLNMAGSGFVFADMDIPDDGLVRNRMLKIADVIMQVVLELFKEADVRESWKDKYAMLTLSDGKALEVTAKGQEIMLKFPLLDLVEPLINPDALKEGLMRIL